MKDIIDFVERYENRHHAGETRIVNKFLWLPKTINREFKWLRHASWVEQMNLVGIIMYEGHFYSQYRYVPISYNKLED